MPLNVRHERRPKDHRRQLPTRPQPEMHALFRQKLNAQRWDWHRSEPAPTGGLNARGWASALSPGQAAWRVPRRSIQYPTIGGRISNATTRGQKVIIRIIAITSMSPDK